MKSISRLFALLILLTAAACGGDGSRDNKTNFRIINAIPDSNSVDVFVDFESFYTGLKFLESTNYLDVDDQSHRVVVNASGSFLPLVDSVFSFSDRSDYTLFLFGPLSKTDYILARDDNSRPSDDTAKVRLINASSKNRKVDAYIVNDPSQVESVAPAERSLTYRERTTYLVSGKGSYHIIITNRDSKTPIASSGLVNLKGNGVYTAIVTESDLDSGIPLVRVLPDR